MKEAKPEMARTTTMAKSDRAQSTSGASDLDITDLASIIFGRGLNEVDVKEVVRHVLHLSPYPTVTRTRHKNFVRAMINLVVYVFHTNTNLSTNMEDMVGKDTGYVDSFEFCEPLKSDVAFKTLLIELYEEIVSEKVKKSYHPSVKELTEQWSGNMRNFICVSLKSSFVSGVYERDMEHTPNGLPKDWNDFLLSIGIDFKKMVESSN